MHRLELEVQLGERSYPMIVASGELDTVGDFARSRSRGSQSLIVADTHTAPLYGQAVAESMARAGFQAATRTVPAGEPSKSAPHLQSLYESLHQLRFDRHGLVVALGGGVVGDLAGYAAATFARGIDLLQLPTSLLAQVDSSVGGKVGINYERADGHVVKNMIGSFHQPVGVFADTAVLRTLPLRELRAGLAEVVKYGVILDADFFAYLESHAGAIMSLDPATLREIVARSCRLKADVVQADERELSGRRAILNYGHTFAHAIESVSRQFNHGEAVALGMLAASRLAERLGRVPAEVTERQYHLVRQFGLPTVAGGLAPDALLAAMYYDKKAKAGRLRFVLPNRIGAVDLVDEVDESAVRTVLNELVAGIEAAGTNAT